MAKAADIIASGDTVLLFDGFCNLCAQSVLFVVKNEKSPAVKFASLQSTLGQDILAMLPNRPDSIVLLKDGQLYSKSEAALLLTEYLKSPINLLRHLRLIPLSVRDLVYDFIAKHRYTFFGKKDQCMIPSAALSKRFL